MLDCGFQHWASSYKDKSPGHPLLSDVVADSIHSLLLDIVFNLSVISSEHNLYLYSFHLELLCGVFSTNILRQV